MTEQEILQRSLVQFIVKDVFKTITDEDILRLVNGQPTYKGQPLTPGQVSILKKEAIMFSKTKLYDVLQNEIRWHARQALDKAQTENDLISARLLSYFVDVLVSKLKKIADL